MNAGRDYHRAMEQAQANADWTGQPRWLSADGHGVYWISKTDPVHSPGPVYRLDPTPGLENVPQDERAKVLGELQRKEKHE